MCTQYIGIDVCMDLSKFARRSAGHSYMQGLLEVWKLYDPVCFGLKMWICSYIQETSQVNMVAIGTPRERKCKESTTQSLFGES